VTLPDWIGRHLPEGARHRLVQADRERMHVVEWGPPDGHAIVLVHGNPT
jgi:hypothetical protein